MKMNTYLFVAAAVSAGLAVSAFADKSCGISCDLGKLVAEDLSHEVRPGGVGGSPFWNVYMKAFMYPPAFDFKRIGGAKSYRFDVVDDRHVTRSFDAERPTASLKPVWLETPAGMVTVYCEALDAEGRSLGVAGRRTFWKRAPFDPRPGAYPQAARPYAEAIAKGYEFVLTMRASQYLLEHGETDPTYDNNSYPTKMCSAIVRAMSHYAKINPARKEAALKLGRAACEYMIRRSAAPNAPCAYFPPTYEDETRPELCIQAAKKQLGKTMMIYPAEGGEAFLDFAAATGEQRYLEQARRIADTYLRLQGPEGTWALMVSLKDGKDASKTRLVPTTVAEFLLHVGQVTGEKRYTDAADRAFAWMEQRGPVKDFCWEGQFEDAKPDRPKYYNLSKHMSSDYALFLLKRFPGDKAKVALARELLRFGEDQFVYWKLPQSGNGAKMVTYPVLAGHHHEEFSFDHWYDLPAVGEQTGWNIPIDASAAKMIRLYLALYAAEKNPIDLLKARTLGDSITRAQLGNGDVVTQWTLPYLYLQTQGSKSGWINCLVQAVEALELLETVIL